MASRSSSIALSRRTGTTDSSTPCSTVHDRDWRCLKPGVGSLMGAAPSCDHRSRWVGVKRTAVPSGSWPTARRPYGDRRDPPLTSTRWVLDVPRLPAARLAKACSVRLSGSHRTNRTDLSSPRWIEPVLARPQIEQQRRSGRRARPTSARRARPDRRRTCRYPATTPRPVRGRRAPTGATPRRPRGGTSSPPSSPRGRPRARPVGSSSRPGPAGRRATTAWTRARSASVRGGRCLPPGRPRDSPAAGSSPPGRPAGPSATRTPPSQSAWRQSSSRAAGRRKRPGPGGGGSGGWRRRASRSDPAYGVAQGVLGVDAGSSSLGDECEKAVADLIGRGQVDRRSSALGPVEHLVGQQQGG